ncbi:MAG TPA: UbiA family prenyltransferase [Acidimicrobiales bacterium]|nr:UbiA family prenyltransferase [Acidimicrobiales bacterium]
MVAVLSLPARAALTARALARACHLEPTVAVSAMSVALAVSTGRSVRGVVAAGLAVLAGQLTVGWHNDWLDAGRDALAGRTAKPIVRGDVHRSTVLKAFTASAIATVALSPLSGWEAGLSHIAAVASALSYNARVKATIISFLPYCISFGLLVAFIALGRHPGQWPAWWAIGGAALMGAGAHFANVVPDIDQDRATGINGLPQRLGARASAVIALALLATSTMVIAAGRNGPPLAGYGALAGGAAVIAVSAFLSAREADTGPPPQPYASRTTKGAGWFRVAMLVALANVVLLVVEGGSL